MSASRTLVNMVALVSWLVSSSTVVRVHLVTMATNASILSMHVLEIRVKMVERAKYLMIMADSGNVSVV